MDIIKKKVNKWFLAYKERGEDIFDLSNLTVIEPEPDTYEADPFLFGDYVFFELYDYRKGCIAYRNLKTNSPPKKVIETDYHMSYPFIFEDEGEVYIVPETGLKNRIELWKATKFPDEWEFVKVLIDGIVAGDTNIFKNGKEYLMFTTENGDSHFRIFRSASLLGNWDLIYATEILNSRSAGNVFEYEGKLIRPVQDCYKHYGEAMIMREITLAPYKEKELRRIEPNWYPQLTGTHTFNFNDKYVIIDGRIKL